MLQWSKSPNPSRQVIPSRALLKPLWAGKEIIDKILDEHSPGLGANYCEVLTVELGTEWRYDGFVINDSRKELGYQKRWHKHPLWTNKDHSIIKEVERCMNAALSNRFRKILTAVGYLRMNVRWKRAPEIVRIKRCLQWSTLWVEI